MKDKLAELDILRIASILIVVILIHIPNDYAYSFYMDLDPYIGYLLHTSGIYVAMGSFAFISGFGLYLNKNNRNINSFEKLSKFVKKRFLRIFPLYWIALILFVLFIGYSNLDPFYILAHVFGIQMIVAPLYGPPILTLWFIGIIVIYYLIFIVLSFSGSIYRILPISIGILFFFAFLKLFFGLMEYRFFFYYLLFILGIVAADIYTSSQYNLIKERIKRIYKLLPLILALGIAILSFLVYLSLSYGVYENFLLEFGTTHLELILDQDPGILVATIVILLVDLRIILFIIFSLSTFYFILGLLRMLFRQRNVGKIFSPIAYSTYCVYLFHRIFLGLYALILMDLLNLSVYERLDLGIVLLFVPFIFLFSYLIQKSFDWVLSLPSKFKSKNVLEKNK